jgi:hypothetical protein
MIYLRFTSISYYKLAIEKARGSILRPLRPYAWKPSRLIKESYTGQNRLYNAGDQGESWDQTKNGTRVHQLPEMPYIFKPAC